MNPEHNPEGDFGLRSGLVTDQSQRRYTYSGIAIYRPEMFKNKQVSKQPLKPYLLEAIENNAASGEFYFDNWFDIGTEQRLKQLTEKLS
jgi:MurNAc alpha-1-phosphate uridylyltransferase